VINYIPLKTVFGLVYTRTLQEHFSEANFSTNWMSAV